MHMFRANTFCLIVLAGTKTHAVRIPNLQIDSRIDSHFRTLAHTQTHTSTTSSSGG
jgi:hypothetical protein